MKRAAACGPRPKARLALAQWGRTSYGGKVCTAGLPQWEQKRKDIEYHLTQNQLTELLDTESARALLEAGEERGWIEPAELEAFAVEHDLADPEVEDVVRELERIGLEVREPVA